MEISYTCSDEDLFFPQTWEGKIRLINPAEGEMEVMSHGSCLPILCG